VRNICDPTSHGWRRFRADDDLRARFVIQVPEMLHLRRPSIHLRSLRRTTRFAVNAAILVPVQGIIMTELTASEVVALFGLDERRVRKDVEHGVFHRSKGPPRFALAEVVYLFAIAAFGLDLGVDDRKKLYGLIAGALAERRPPRSIELGTYLELQLAAAVQEVQRRIERFATWKKRLVTRDDILGGEPVFPKSRLAVRQVGEMALRGASVEEILEDYPYLDEQDIEFAKQFVTAYPRVGRPRVREAPAR
jgi:uncharacterized protein (DUF433 family)